MIFDKNFKILSLLLLSFISCGFHSIALLALSLRLATAKHGRLNVDVAARGAYEGHEGAAEGQRVVLQVALRARDDEAKDDAATLAAYRRTSEFDGDLLRRPGMESWMFDDENKLKGDQSKFDWKEVPFREDQLGGYDPDLTPRAVDPKLAPVLIKLSEVFGNAIEVLEAPYLSLSFSEPRCE